MSNFTLSPPPPILVAILCNAPLLVLGPPLLIIIAQSLSMRSEIMSWRISQVTSYMWRFTGYLLKRISVSLDEQLSFPFRDV